MQIKAMEVPTQIDSLGVLGYLIVSNKQVHNYQILVLDEYVSSLGLALSDSCLSPIIKGEENSLSLSSSLAAFSYEKEAVQRDLIKMLYILALVDHVLDKNEEELIQTVLRRSHVTGIEAIRQEAEAAVAEFQEINNIVFTIDRQPVKESFFQKLKRWILHFFLRFTKRKALPDKEFSDIDYMGAISRCTEIAKEDFSIVKPVYEEIQRQCENTIAEINQYKRELSYETDLSAETAKIIGEFANLLSDGVYSQVESARHALEQKERTVSDFTISLLGRTKAGKSTLHAILTNQGEESIGIGMQRTTRYNRVYQWNLIRLIDTPGIGSAEAAGRNDEEIAESVLGESDIICFVVVDDSIQKDIFEFLERIAERNKPIIILLNHKENIIPDVKFQQFLDHPDQWLTTKGESRLQGHIDRIQKYADSKGFGRLLRIYPVFLLAALLSNKEKYVEHQDLLWQHSNIDAFINQLKSWIYTGGTIKRSQTILDEAVMSFSQALETLEKAETLLTDQIQKIDSQKRKRMEELRQTQSQVLQNLRNDLRRIYTDLGGKHALAFAEEEADKKKPPIEEDWKEFVDGINFQKQVSDAIENNVRQYQNKVEALTEEIFEDLNFGIQNSFGKANIKLPSSFSYRAAVNIVGGLLGLAGSIVLLFSPVGWVLAIAGILVGLLSGLFKSKEEKRQERIDAIYESIHKAVTESMDKNIENIMSEVENVLLTSTGKIEQLLCDLSDGLKRIESMSTELKQAYRRKNYSLNKVYAWRIIQYITRSLEPYSPEAVSETILHVDRSNPSEIIIRTSVSVDQKNMSFDGILAENIRVIKE